MSIFQLDIRGSPVSIGSRAEGSEGTEALCVFEPVLETLRHYDREGSLIGAICAGPTVLYAAGILNGRRVTCYPGAEKRMPGIAHQASRVVRDGHVITSRAAGTAFDFALALIEYVDGQAAAVSVQAALSLLP